MKVACARLKTTGVEGTISRDVRRTLRSEPSSPRVRRAATYWLMCWLPRPRRRRRLLSRHESRPGALLETAARAGSLEDDHKIILSAVEERRCQQSAFLVVPRYCSWRAEVYPKGFAASIERAVAAGHALVADASVSARSALPDACEITSAPETIRVWHLHN